MFWKDWSYWLKGGIIAIITAICISIIGTIILFTQGNTKISLGIFYLVLVLIALGFEMGVFIAKLFGISCHTISGYWISTTCPSYLESIGIITLIILCVVIIFLIGAGIGFIVGKIKRKK